MKREISEIIENVNEIDSSIHLGCDNLIRDCRTLKILKRRCKERSNNLSDVDQSEFKQILSDVESMLYYVCKSLDESIDIFGYLEAPLDEIRCEINSLYNSN